VFGWKTSRFDSKVWGETNMKFLSGLQPLALLALRWTLSLIFIYHGYPKLAHPTDAMRDFFTSHGFPGYFLGLAGILESFGSLLLFVGLFTRPAALLLASEMAIAIWKVHSTHGIMAVKDYEFPLTLAAACLALGTIGAGVFSLDHLIVGEGGKKRRFARSSKE
jgi:putative oxidoreductase